MDAIAEKIIKARNENGGRTPRSCMSKYLKDLERVNIPATREMLKHRIKLLDKSRPLPEFPAGIPPEIAVGTGTVASGLTSTGSGGTFGTSPASHSDGIIVTSIASHSERTQTDLRTSTEKPNGRPKGTTKKAKQELESLKRRLLDEVSVEHAKRFFDKGSQDGSNARLPKGTLASIIEEKRAELNVPDSVSISVDTVRHRLSKSAKSLTPRHRGTISPLAEIDRLVLPIVIGMGRIHQPMSSPEIIELANSLIDGTVHQDCLILWKQKSHGYQSAEDIGKVGVGYFRGFMKRYGDIVAAKTPRRFASDRSEWMHRENLLQMYRCIYDVFCDAGTARKLDREIAYDFEGKMVPVGSPEQFGLPSNIEIIHKDHILFGDECGINTCQRDDGKHGGKKVIVAVDVQAGMIANTSNHRATILPFTSLAGNPVVIAVIFASNNEEIKPLWHSGVDVKVTPIFNKQGEADILNQENHGPGKYFPYGPQCEFNGKTIPTLTFTSPNGSITSEILVKIFSRLDEMKVYDRSDGAPEPCVVVDGHDSRLSRNFLEYINHRTHKWNFALGVPYLTHLWQVGDSSEQNGSFKIAFSKAKDEMMAFKMRMGWAPKLEATDIIPLVNKAWAKSFVRVESNKKAIANRGWYPPTKNILTDPLFSEGTEDVVTQEAPNVSSETLDSFNTTRGHSANVLDRLLTHHSRKEGTRRRHEALAEGEMRRVTFEGLGRITAGAVIKQGMHGITNPDLLAAVRERDKLKKAEANRKKNEDNRKLLGLKRKVDEMRETKGRFEPSRWNSSDCKSYLQYKKQKGEKGKMPSLIVELRKQCLEWMHRPSPNPTPCTSDAEEDDAEEDKSTATNETEHVAWVGEI